MKKTQARSAMNRSRRKFIVGSAAAGGGLALGFHLPFGVNPGIRRRSPGRGGERVERVGGGQARRHLRHPHRARGDGTGHAYRPRAARRRGAGVRLEEDRHRADYARPEPGAQARVARHVDRRQPRHPRLAGLRPPGRRGGAHHARAGGGQRMEGAGERAHRGQRDHHARGLRTLDELRQGRGCGRQAARAGVQEHQAQESAGVESRRQAR